VSQPAQPDRTDQPDQHSRKTRRRMNQAETADLDTADLDTADLDTAELRTADLGSARYDAEADTAELALPRRDEKRVPQRWIARRLRGLSGCCAAGLAVLALLVLAAQILGWSTGEPGPGAGRLATHLVAAVLAVLVQRVADRRQDVAGAVAAVAVLAVTGATLWLMWWM
jgi:hypothetical protein